jgi:ubiquitin-protein ligase E3 D
MTLNDLLFEAAGLNPFIPERRHSMPSATRASASSIAEPSTRLVLQTLLNNFRSHEAQGEMVETRESATDSDLMRELQVRVKGVSHLMVSSDAALANALVSLLLNLSRLSDLQASTAQSSNQALNEGSSNLVDSPNATDVFDTLTRQLSDLQIKRLSSPLRLFAPGMSPLVTVETSLLWSQIDSELENVVSLCKQRTESLPQFVQDYLPPEYDFAVKDSENPPDYDVGGRTLIDDTKSKAGHSAQAAVRSVEEKMKLDLEAVAVAIDRLYLVAPQLHNQRVELKSSKLAEMEKARREGRTAMSEERDIKELERMLDLLGKASERTIRDQSVFLDGGMQSRMDKVHQKESAKVRSFFYYDYRLCV